MTGLTPVLSLLHVRSLLEVSSLTSWIECSASVSTATVDAAVEVLAAGAGADLRDADADADAAVCFLDFFLPILLARVLPAEIPAWPPCEMIRCLACHCMGVTHYCCSMSVQ